MTASNSDGNDRIDPALLRGNRKPLGDYAPSISAGRSTPAWRRSR